MPGKTKSTIMIDTDLWKRLKVISVLNEFEISELVEEALREKLARMQQPEQYAEYKDVESLRYKPRTTPQQQMHQPAEQPQSQPQPKQREPVVHSSRYEAAKSGRGQSQLQPQEQKPGLFEEETKAVSLEEMQDSGYPIFMGKIDYPTNRNKLVKHIKELQYEFLKKYNRVPLLLDQALLIIESLPDKSYKNIDDLYVDLAIVVNDKKIAEKLLGSLTKTTKVHGCVVYDFFTRKDRIPIDRRIAMDGMMKLDRRLRNILNSREQRREFRGMLERYQQDRSQDTKVAH